MIGHLPAVRVLELPRRPARGDPGRGLRLAAIVSAYHGGKAVLLGWHRRAAGEPIEVFVSGGISDGRALSLPPGAVGCPYGPGKLVEDLGSMPCWTRLTVLTDGLLAEETPRDNEPRSSLDEGLLHVWPAGFAWFVLAEPVPVAETLEAARAVAAEERRAQTRAQSPEQAVAAARQRARHRELQQGRSTGMWRVRLLAGGESPEAAAAVAGLLCASADLGSQPYALAPTGVLGELDKVLDGEPPTLAGSPLVASLAVTPSEEVPGLRFATRPEFDVTPETAGGPGSLNAGTVLDRSGRAAGPFEVPRDSLNRHTFICGATGAGKSQTVRHLLESASRQELPWLVVEPAKAEYRRMAARLGPGRVITVRPGDPDAPPAGFNPLRPADGFPLQTHLDLTRSLFLAAFAAEEPFPQVLSSALTRCYEELGWDLTLSEPRTPGHRPRYPTLADLQRTAELVVDRIGYGQEIADNVRGFIRVRLSSLRLGTTGRFFDGGHPLDLAAMLRHEVVFEIEDVGDDQDKAFLMGGLLIQLTEHLRVNPPRGPGLRHLSVFEEAHRLLRRRDQPGPAAHAVELFAALLAEIRAYGEGLVIAEQIPAKLVPDVLKNTAVKIMHRLPAADDRQAVGATVNLTERQSEYLVTLPPGTAALFTDGMDHPVLVRMPDGTSRESMPAEVAGPGPVIGRRSATCGAVCRAGACTLRAMRTAQRLLDDRPWLTFWAEVAVVGHLTGRPVPPLWDTRRDELDALDERLRECALSQAVDAAVHVRALGAAVSPDDLAVRVVAGDPVSPEFVAPGYRHLSILDALRDRPDDDPADPRAAAWSSWLGREVLGDTVGAQREWVEFWASLDPPGPAALFGWEVPSALEIVVGADRSSTAWGERLALAVTDTFQSADWIPDLLELE
ncbi:ATP-binding protein [Actinoplanes sp. LDG1-06]|uniref:ATP-binding protein n=1 Tax=Paractinoplanes ovalisporus TaxID=2810368 RepID=A0ABS2AU53_9ACTN|nr:ATP-binding protein [Actinoplanes ovalisporus]MBM2623336.1 ATP-binding protein [Actinoplanes ovalisporus]